MISLQGTIQDGMSIARACSSVLLTIFRSGTPGFNATAGWDPVTGLGTPDFGKLKKIAAP
jgi:hypothetical protein